MKSIIKKIIPRNTLLFSFGKKVYNSKFWRPSPWDRDIFIEYVNSKQIVNFIQIGSNNGISGDPLFQYVKHRNWRGVLVEPVPYLFEALKENYKEISDRLTFENSAIASKSGLLKFYRLRKSDRPDLPEWYDQLGSFKKDVILKHRNSIPNFDRLFLEDTVKAITFKELLEKYNIDEIDLIHIDTEGYDFEIIKMIPFAQLNIELLMFEHKHLSNLNYWQAIRLLKKHGFEARPINGDTVAVSKAVLDRISLSNTLSVG